VEAYLDYVDRANGKMKSSERITELFGIAEMLAESDTLLGLFLCHTLLRLR
jgi:hypothetical protein